jgi:hypothetical protein
MNRIQLLINIDADRAQIIRCDGLIESVEIPVTATKDNPKLGLVCSTDSLLTLVRVVVETLEEATHKAEMLHQLTRLKVIVDELKARE